MDYGDVPEVINLRFTRVVFRINSSPFMLNAMIDCHKQIYQEINPLFVDEFLSSIYVVDVSIGSDNAESTYELYLNSKSRLAEAGFKLRKFVTNSEEGTDCEGTGKGFRGKGRRSILCLGHKVS